MKPERDIRQLFHRAAVNTDAGTDEEVLAKVLAAHETASSTGSIPNRSNVRSTIMRSPITRLALAAAVLVAVLIGTNMLGGSLGSVAWADVERQFESVPFFGLTIYIGQGDAPPAKRIEIWKSADSRMRVHDADRIIFAGFADGDGSIVAFDRSTGKPAEAGMLTKALLEAFLHPQGQFSLGTLTSAISQDATDLVPVEVADNAPSREIAVFEMKMPETGECLRIWALRDSKLPIQMQFRDPRNHEYGDFFFDYTQEKDTRFFDPKAFIRQ